MVGQGCDGARRCDQCLPPSLGVEAQLCWIILVDAISFRIHTKNKKVAMESQMVEFDRLLLQA